MFGKRKPRSMPIQGINGMIPQTQAQPRGMFKGPTRYAQASQPAQPKKFSTDRIAAALGSLASNDGGAGIRNYDANMQAQMQQQMAQQQQLQNIAAATQNMTPQEAALWINPQAASEAMSKRLYGHNPVAAGASVATYGMNSAGPTMTQAAQNFQNGSQIARMDGSGAVTSTDLGMNASDRVTSQNNIATQGLRQGELDETIRYNNITDENTDFSNQTGRMDAVTGRNRLGLERDRLSFDQDQATNPSTQFSASERKSFNDQAGAAKRAFGAIDRYRSLIKQHGRRGLPFGEDVATMQTAHTNAQMELKNAYELGVLAGADLDLINKALPTPTGLIHDDGRAIAKLDELGSYMRNVVSTIPDEFRPDMDWTETGRDLQSLSDEELDAQIAAMESIPYR